MDNDRPKRQNFKRYPVGYFHIDIAEWRTNEGKRYLFVVIDRTSKFAVAQLLDKANRKTVWEFLAAVLEAVPYKTHTILTDNSIQFCEQQRNRNTPYSRPMRFDMICATNGIEHRLTKPNHPWTNGQVEQMYRTIKEATVKRYRYDNHVSSVAISLTFLTPKTTRAASKHSVVSNLTTISAKPGHSSQIYSF